MGDISRDVRFRLAGRFPVSREKRQGFPTAEWCRREALSVTERRTDVRLRQMKIYFSTNRMASTHIVMFIFFMLPQNVLITT